MFMTNNIWDPAFHIITEHLDLVQQSAGNTKITSNRNLSSQNYKQMVLQEYLHHTVFNLNFIFKDFVLKKKKKSTSVFTEHKDLKPASVTEAHSDSDFHIEHLLALVPQKTHIVESDWL